MNITHYNSHAQCNVNIEKSPPQPIKIVTFPKKTISVVHDRKTIIGLTSQTSYLLM